MISFFHSVGDACINGLTILLDDKYPWCGWQFLAVRDPTYHLNVGK
jgi:hypothetical protein